MFTVKYNLEKCFNLREMERLSRETTFILFIYFISLFPHEHILRKLIRNEEIRKISSFQTCIKQVLMPIDYEIFSMFILFLALIQEGQLSVSGERMCKILVDRLED